MHQSRQQKLDFLKNFKHISAPYGPKIWHFKILVAPKQKKSNATQKVEIVKLSCTDVNTVSSRDRIRKYLKSEKYSSAHYKIQMIILIESK